LTPAAVSVAICTWNRAEALGRTLESFLAMRVPAGLRWELIVVNNNGTDATDAVVASFSGRLPVRLLKEPRPGKCYAANLAVEAAIGDLILWTDDDVEVDAGWMESLLSGFVERDADFVFGVSTPLWPAPAPDWFSPLHNGLFAVLDYGPEPFRVTSPSTPFYGLNFAVRRQAVLDLGGFREDLGVVEDQGGMEDIELFRRAIAAGLTIVYVPGAVIHHVVPPARMFKAFHRTRMKAGLPMYYRTVLDQYGGAASFLGVPRFLYGKALSDALGYARSMIARDEPARFFYELQLIKFNGLRRQAAAERKARRGGRPAASVGGHQA
jgi:glycosyltransferase involved in cell wall biosynthesis